MIRGMMAAMALLTRVPMGSESRFSAVELGRSARWFPLVGLGIGCAYAATVTLAGEVFPPILVGLVVVLVEAVLTGALHLDGLADMADGFGGGRTREDVLRIMRDHAVGTYGAVALILLVGLKVTSIAALVETSAALPYVIVTPAIGRWSAVFMSTLQPYARHSEGVSDHVGRTALIIATAVAAVPTLYLLGWHSVPLAVAAIGITFAMSEYCKRRIGGITGDTIGANTEVVEVVVLLTAVALSRG